MTPFFFGNKYVMGCVAKDPSVPEKQSGHANEEDFSLPSK
jgi:hypothetical protein